MKALKGFLLASVLAAGLGLAATAPATADPYIALGDSVTAFSGTYADKLYPFAQAELGANEFLKRAQPGATSDSILNHGQLATSLADINSASDTKMVTAGIGGGDVLFGPCNTYNMNTCPFRNNFAEILQQIKTALDADPGSEKIVVLAYFNPKNGLPSEDEYDKKILGANEAVGMGDTGADLGLNDVIYQEAAALGIPVADPFDEFKAQGQSVMLDDAIHPNDAGHEIILDKFCEAAGLECGDAPPTCETDQTLCPPPPTCETDASLCPPAPTCETDASLCPDPPDTKAPRTKLTKGPIRIGKRSVKFKFRSSEKGSRFQCSLDGGKFRKCRSPKKLKHLKRGRHTFRVRARDAAGNVDRTPAKRKFRIRRR